jgi:hypothetical protein
VSKFLVIFRKRCENFVKVRHIIVTLFAPKITFHFSSSVPSSPWRTERYSESESQCCPSLDNHHSWNQVFSSLYLSFCDKQVVTLLLWSFRTTHIRVYGPTSTTARPSWLQNQQYLAWKPGYTTVVTSNKHVIVY